MRAEHHRFKKLRSQWKTSVHAFTCHNEETAVDCVSAHSVSVQWWLEQGEWTGGLYAS